MQYVRYFSVLWFYSPYVQSLLLSLLSIIYVHRKEHLANWVLSLPLWIYKSVSLTSPAAQTGNIFFYCGKIEKCVQKGWTTNGHFYCCLWDTVTYAVVFCLTFCRKNRALNWNSETFYSLFMIVSSSMVSDLFGCYGVIR